MVPIFSWPPDAARDANQRIGKIDLGPRVDLVHLSTSQAVEPRVMLQTAAVWIGRGLVLASIHGKSHGESEGAHGIPWRYGATYTDLGLVCRGVSAEASGDARKGRTFQPYLGTVFSGGFFGRGK